MSRFRKPKTALVRQKTAVTFVYSHGITGAGGMAVVVGPSGKAGFTSSPRPSIPINGGHKRVLL